MENNKGEKIGELIKKSEQETPQLAIANTQTQPETPQPAIENTLAPQPVENNEGVIYDVDLENTLNNMKKMLVFLKQKREIMVMFFGMDFQLKK